METLPFSGLFLNPWVIASGISLATMLTLLLLKRLILGRTIALLGRSRFTMDSLIASALPWPLTLLILCLTVIVFKSACAYLGITSDQLAAYAGPLEYFLLILAIVVFVDRLCSGAIRCYAEQSDVLRGSRSILQGITRGIVWGLGLLILMGTVGISITPVIASLGITSLAVALALQPTLENFFSGVQLLMDKPIRVGDFIELDSGEQGFVDRIGWRSTWVRMLPNNMVIMPNSKLSGSKIINYYYPAKELSVPVEVGVHYDSDLDHVERVTLEVAREILKTHEWGVAEYNTFVLFHTFDNSSINFTVMLRAKEYFNRFWVKSAFVKALHKRYAEEGIRIPYPIRAINLDQEAARGALHGQDKDPDNGAPS
ncbi:mechanosensitive ion channel family protein [Marinobacter sp. F4206]|uniref:mechanosensitive ion channel family protein n=1 Tax=Marinobacter sp. F4206 TaxID=2861777 RepID=UPI001C5EF782|nr:mechanosensitive ion channel family protein [Marinobacter sp. F4206]MBW4934099.1 mechanosensitive ion channel family protein [Marinobacter sp. F4206]